MMQDEKYSYSFGVFIDFKTEGNCCYDIIIYTKEK